MHARSGGNIEIMGLMQGKVQDDAIIVMDAFALPVEGTETRVNAQSEGYEYMVEYMRVIKQVGRLENAVGWYHSHPGYGCWLSGIDVDTQVLNQQYQEPFLAIVIDPTRTVSAGRVDIGAFRTYPQVGHRDWESRCAVAHTLFRDINLRTTVHQSIKRFLRTKSRTLAYIVNSVFYFVIP